MDLSFIVSLLFLSSFIRILLVLAILRRGLGFSDLPSAIVVLLFSVALSVSGLPVSPQGAGAPVTLVFSEQRLDPQRERELTQFLAKKTDPEVAAELQRLVQSREGSASLEQGHEPQFGVMVGAYALSEVRKAFRMGVTFLVPFVVIDVLLAVLLSAIGVTTMSVEMISFPVKLVTFLMLDGWSLVVGSLFK